MIPNPRYKERPCKICGKMFYPVSSVNVCCSKECTKINNRYRSRFDQHDKQYKQRKKQKHVQQSLTITAIQKLAAAEHMSYGEYVAKHNI